MMVVFRREPLLTAYPQQLCQAYPQQLCQQQPSHCHFQGNNTTTNITTMSNRPKRACKASSRYDESVVDALPDVPTIAVADKRGWTLPTRTAAAQHSSNNVTAPSLPALPAAAQPPQTKKSKKNERKYKNQMPAESLQVIAANYNASTAVAERNLPSVGVTMPSVADVELAVHPPGKDPMDRVMQSRQSRFGYTDTRMNGGATPTENYFLSTFIFMTISRSIKLGINSSQTKGLL